VASLEVLLEFGANFSGADRTWGNTPLYFILSCTHSSSTVKAGLRWLLEHGANPNAVSHAQGVAETALHAAVKHDWDPDTIELLLQHGADPGARTASGRTAYALAVSGGREAVVSLLKARGAETEISMADRFFGACMRADRATACELLTREPAIIRGLSPEDRKIVLAAAREGRAAAIGLMSELGFDLEIKGADGERPLHWAAWHGWADTVHELIVRGVELSECDSRFCAQPSGWCAHGSQFCGNAAGEYGKVMELLIAAGAQVAPDTNGSPEIMVVLKKHGITGKRAR
jgi:ankyrin repeat protein